MTQSELRAECEATRQAGFDRLTLLVNGHRHGKRIKVFPGLGEPKAV